MAEQEKDVVPQEPVKEEKKEEKEGKKIDTKSDGIVLVSRGRPVVVYAKRLKKSFETREKVILQGLGKAIMPTVELSQYLVHNMGCSISKIETMTTSVGIRKKIEKIAIEVARGETTLAAPSTETPETANGN
eukprot:CAMPEP_0184491316 /NCGR_PEP_ID=MMETSP0113_2-20130426/20132_1 /TAXON_ID=91329 /ORGANISM="Norrisiella sphaerica, Strain BC52" /LENGTH=131 /DNA_ID=CAMNT_0026875635 /DNA_START=3 /DNA_END=398 /DNA_ORIENTATION=+